MADAFISIDLGTTRLKVAAFDATGVLLHQVATRHTEAGNGQDADDWWTHAVAAIRTVAKAAKQMGAGEISGMSISGRAGAGVFTDASGAVLAHPWSDNRHREQLNRLYEWRKDRFLANYGAALVAKYLWLRDNEPQLARRIRRAHYAKDFLLFRLTGAHKTDWSSGPDRSTWGDELLTDFGLPDDLLPEPALPWEIGGLLDAGAASALELKPGIPVAVGAHDGICANVGAGATREGEYAITLGTHAVTRTATAKVPDGAYRFYGLPPDRHIVGGNAIMGGRSADWFLDIACSGCDRAEAFQTMDRAASKVAPGAEGVSFLPFLSGQVAPQLRLGASGMFAGLRAHHDRAHLYRAVLEGAAFAIADIFEQITGWCGEPNRVRLTGGGSSSAVWTEILANVLGRPLEVSDEAVEGRGAIIFLTIALGRHSNYDEAADTMVPITSVVDPNDGRVAEYQKLHEHWQTVSETTKPLDG